jgi:polyisoprenoid-binding protein YceI
MLNQQRHPIVFMRWQWLLVITVALIFTVSHASANALTVDTAKSTIAFSFKQSGIAVQGRFTKFDAKIFFDVKKLDASKAEFSVDISSVELGDPAYNDESVGPDWFNTRKFPRATFVADKFSASADSSKLEATGKLTIKGVSQPIKAQFSVTGDAVNPIVEGNFIMKRRDWNIGDNEWKAIAIVADEVTVSFKFVTSK